MNLGPLLVFVESKMTRKEKIDFIVGTMPDWDEDVLFKFAVHMMLWRLTEVSTDKEVDDYYEEIFEEFGE